MPLFYSNTHIYVYHIIIIIQYTYVGIYIFSNMIRERAKGIRLNSKL